MADWLCLQLVLESVGLDSRSSSSKEAKPGGRKNYIAIFKWMQMQCQKVRPVADTV